MDTDEEVSNGKVNILNGNGPPYFHSYLYMKGKKSNDSIFLYKINSLMQCLTYFDSKAPYYCQIHYNVIPSHKKQLRQCCSHVFVSSVSSTAGLMIPWRRRWCVLKDDTFMWFRSKQESLKSGWLYKKGGGLSTLSRRNWKMRWFVLRDSKLMYYENDSEEKLKGTIDIHSAK